jgi:hypothetical protein
MSDYVVLIGLRVRMRRTTDRPCGVCGESVIVIGLGAGLHCARCMRHRGRLPQSVADFLIETIAKFGQPPATITIRTIPKTDREPGRARDWQVFFCALNPKGPRS